MRSPGRVLVLVVVAPLLVVMPFVVTFAGLALVGPVADPVSASIDVVHDAGLAVLVGIALGAGTVAAVVVVVALAREAMPDGAGRDLLTALGLGIVATPLLLLVAAPRFEDDVDVGDPAGRFIVELAAAETDLARGTSIGAVVAVAAAAWLLATHRLTGLQPFLRRRVLDAFTDDRPPPDYR